MENAGSAALDIAELDVSYDAVAVLKQVSLSVAAGEFVALLVPSVAFMLFIERFLKADVLAKVGI